MFVYVGLRTECMFLSRTSCYLSPILPDPPVHGYAHPAPVDQRNRLLQALIGHYEFGTVELESRGQFHAHVPLRHDLLVTRCETHLSLVPSRDTVLMPRRGVGRRGVDPGRKVTEVPWERGREDGRGDRQDSLWMNGHTARRKRGGEIHLWTENMFKLMTH